MPFENIMTVGLKRQMGDFLHAAGDNLWKAQGCSSTGR
jgi:hypothetical protein